MISKYKKKKKKTVMGYLSYLPDFKNIKNLQEEMKLYTSDSNQFEVLIYQQDGNARGIVGIQEEKDFIIIRYLSLDPTMRDEKTKQLVMNDLKHLYPDKMITALPNWASLLNYLKENKTDE